MLTALRTNIEDFQIIAQILKTTVTVFNAVNSEVTYWKQIEQLQIKLEQTSDALSTARENEEDLARHNFELVAENKALKDEVQNSHSAYQSLLKDYHQMMDKHREFKRNVHAVTEKALLEFLGETNAI